MNHYIFGVAAYMAAGLLSLLFGHRIKGYVVAAGALIGSTEIVSAAIAVLQSGTSVSLRIDAGMPIGRILLSLDPLSAFFSIVIAVGSALAVVYGIGYLAPSSGETKRTALHWLFLVGLIVSMLLVIIVQTVFPFLLVWELMSVSSFLLVMFRGERPETRSAGLNYLVTMHIGLLFLFVGLLIPWAGGGSADFADFPHFVRAHPEMLGLVVLFLFAGFGLKAGFIPLHTWLPKAHPVAPSHVSGLMSGVMIKIGIYGILRFAFLFAPLPAAAVFTLLAVSIVSAVFGVLFAIEQHDLKRLLAYHSVENIGIIGIGISVGMLGQILGMPAVALLGFVGALLHVLNHSIFKNLLFFGAGSIQRSTGEMGIDRLGGIAKWMPMTTVFFLTGSIAISGLPPFNGFVSEYLIYLGMIRGLSATSTIALVALVATIAFLALVGALALFCFTKVIGVVFLGAPRTERRTVTRENGLAMLVPMGLLALLCLFIGVVPQPAVLLATSAVVASTTGLASAAGTASIADASAVASLLQISRLLLAFVVVSLVAGVLVWVAGRRRPPRREPTWGCGYPAVNPRMQYTGESYAHGLLSLVRPRAAARESRDRLHGIFPEPRTVHSHVDDPLDVHLLRPAVGGLLAFFRRFSWIQNGNLQLYIAYGLIFLIAALIWTVGAPK
ncbi:MAG TPA: proton-conducting transporter membrane subunit [Spirochaetia bacterium]|nr:proton-conducting transporter membrane subunit [Spirochaetia bacterium]